MCRSCRYITFNLVCGARYSITGKKIESRTYCEKHEMLCDTEEASIRHNNLVEMEIAVRCRYERYRVVF